MFNVRVLAFPVITPMATELGAKHSGNSVLTRPMGTESEYGARHSGNTKLSGGVACGLRQTGNSIC